MLLVLVKSYAPASGLSIIIPRDTGHHVPLLRQAVLDCVDALRLQLPDTLFPHKPEAHCLQGDSEDPGCRVGDKQEMQGSVLRKES